MRLTGKLAVMLLVMTSRNTELCLFNILPMSVATTSLC
jgi:hypothetical protein